MLGRYYSVESRLVVGAAVVDAVVVYSFLPIPCLPHGTGAAAMPPNRRGRRRKFGGFRACSFLIILLGRLGLSIILDLEDA